MTFPCLYTHSLALNHCCASYVRVDSPMACCMSCRSGKPYVVLPPEEARVRAVAEVVHILIQAVKEGKDIDLNQLKCDVSRKYNLARWACSDMHRSCMWIMQDHAASGPAWCTYQVPGGATRHAKGS